MIPEIILGPPGTGKTTTLLGIVEEELSKGVPPDRIGYISFTKRAATEAIDRACVKFNLQKADLRYFRTIHSLCFNALGLNNGDVFEGKKLSEFGEWIGLEMSDSRVSEDGTLFGFTIGDRALFMENLARVRCVSLREQYEISHDNVPWHLIERVSRALNRFKQDKHLLDYTDMLEQFVQLDWSPNLEVLLIDEAQDLSLLQYQVVQKLAKSCRRVVYAGDDDQAIYRWAGAAVEYFINLQGNVRVLGQSWRCTPEIQSVSSRIIERIGERREKEWNPRQGKGLVNRVKSFDDVDLSDDDILILGRNAFVLRDVMPTIRSDGIIYDWHGFSSVRQTVLDAVRDWERLRAGEEITVEEARHVYEYMSSVKGVKRGFKTLPNLPPTMPVDMNYLREQGGLVRSEIWHEALDRIPSEEMIYLLRARQKGEKTFGKPRVRLSTIHSAKGGEANHVVLLEDMASRTFEEMQVSPYDEARVWYVGVTRAKTQLTIVAGQTNMAYDV